jgi:hypothetical protein
MHHEWSGTLKREFATEWSEAMRLIVPAIVVFTGFAALLPAQSTQTMRANIRGGGGDHGKCTIEVEVDGVADVEVRGDVGRIRTLQGQPSNWRRFECNSVMPRNPVGFRFKGVDGRGNVQLVRDPGNSGVAVVRIEDKKGGREGYTFDLEWSGGSGAYGYDTDDRLDRRRDDPYDRRDDRYDRRDDRYDRNSRDQNLPGYSNANDAVGMCQDAVRVRARTDHGVRNPRFTASSVDDLRGNRDRIVGSFEGNRREQYDYACTVNLNNGRIRAVDVRRR